MAFLFHKFQEAIKILAKSPTFSKDPRHLQFEADINKLFLYTSYNRLGRDAEEGDAEEIIEMANKASLVDQHKQVEENIHSQVKVLCKCMDDILLPYQRRKVGLNRNEISKRLKELVGHSVVIKPSGIQHKEAGLGLFLDGEAQVGDVIAFYPGIVYSPVHYSYIPTTTNYSYLITRYDRSVINAQPWGFGGETRQVWKIKEEEGDIVDFRNPLAFGHFANHPSKGTSPNVMVCPYDFPLFEKAMRPYIPNIAFDGGEGREEENATKYASFRNWFKSSSYTMGAVSDCGNSLVLKSVVLVATRAIVSGEEVLLNYRLTNSEPRPSWYTPVSEEDEDE